MREKWFAFRGLTPRSVCSIEGASADASVGGGTESAVVDTSAADAVDTSSVDDTVDTTDVYGETQDTTETGETKPEVKPVVEDTEPGEDGVSPKVKGLIESLKKTDPATAKQVKNLVYADAAFRKEFPGGLKEVQALKQSVDELAGEEGLDGLKESVGVWKSIDDRFAKGDPSVLEDFAKFNPDSFEKIIPPAIEKLAQSNAAAYGECMPSAMDKLSQVAPEVYSRYMSGVLTATLDNYQITDTIANLVRSLGTIKDGDGNVVASDEIKALNGIIKTVDGFRELAKKVPEAKAKPETKVDPERAKLEADRERLQQEKTQIVINQVNDGAVSHATKQYDELVTAELKSSGLDYDKDSQQYKSIVRDIDAKIGSLIDGDNDFKRKFNNLIAAGNTKDAIKLANARFDLVAFKSVRAVVGLWSRKSPAAAKAATTATAQPAKKTGIVELQSAPDSSKVDWDRTSRQDYLFGKAYLKGDNRLHKF